MAAFYLAKELGYADVDGMLEQMDSSVFYEWIAFLSMSDKEKDMKPVTDFENDASMIYGRNR